MPSSKVSKSRLPRRRSTSHVAGDNDSSIRTHRTRSGALLSNLYKDLEKLERSVDDDFKRYLIDTFDVSFELSRAESPLGHLPAPKEQEEEGSDNGSAGSILGHLEPVPFVTETRPPFGTLDGVSMHSDREILGDILDLVKSDDDPSWLNKEEGDLMDEKYSGLPLVNNPSGSASGKMSPGQYFAARSLPLDSIDDLWENANEESFSKRRSSNASSSQQRPSSSNQSVRAGAIYEEKGSSLAISERQRSSSQHTMDDPITEKFKALPDSLSHSHQLNFRNLETILSKRLSLLRTGRAASHKGRSRTLSPKRKSLSSYQSGPRDASSRRDSYVSIPVIRQDETSNGSVVSGSVRLRRLNSAADAEAELQQQEEEQSAEEEDDDDHPGYNVAPCPLVLEYFAPIQEGRPEGSYLRITNEYTQQARSYSIFSARGKLKILHRQGVLPAAGYVDIAVRPRRSALHSFVRALMTAERTLQQRLFERLLVLVDGKYAQRIPVEMLVHMKEDQMQKEPEATSQPDALSDDQSSYASHPKPSHQHVPSIAPISENHVEGAPKCPFCAMEQQCVKTA